MPRSSLHDIGVYALDLRAVPARAFAHFIERQLRLFHERRQIELNRFGYAIGGFGAVLLAAFVGVAFDADYRKRLIHVGFLFRQSAS